jgi:hypothetical protein
MTAALGLDDPDPEFEALWWLHERGFDVEEQLKALGRRRHEEAVTERAPFEELIAPIKDEFSIGTRLVLRALPTVEERRAAASLIRVDLISGTTVWPSGRIEQVG